MDEVTTDFPLLFFTTNAENDIFATTNNQLTTNQSDLNILNKDDIQITEDVHTTAATLISEQGIFNTLLHVSRVFLVLFYSLNLRIFYAPMWPIDSSKLLINSNFGYK